MRIYATSLLPLLLLTACEGVFDEIYDLPVSDTSFEEGFHDSTRQSQKVLTLDATNYSEWIFVDLHSKAIERMPIPVAETETGEWDGRSGLTYQLVDGSRFTKLDSVATAPQPEPEEWDLAFHHFDVRTNGGLAAELPDVSLDNACSADFNSLAWTADVWSDHDVIVDLKEMMGFKIGYQNSYVNTVISGWVKMDISTPPPIYSATGSTYVVKFRDGSVGAFKLRDYFSPSGTKGYLTIDFIYPCE